MRSLSLPISVFVGAFALAACGGDDDGDGAGGAAGSAGSSGSTVEPAKMVQLPAGFWIDSTEVTRAQYQAWLDTDPATAGQRSECTWNASYVPGCHWPPGDEPDHPVVCVDWCDAHAYCQGVGKRLCGRIGGGPNGMENYADETKSQWYYACSSGGSNEYPYGDDYDATACNLADSSLETMAPAGSFGQCQSGDAGFGGVFDLCGNVSEWVDACEAVNGPDDSCNQRDGTFVSSPGASRCRLAAASNRDERWEGLGFRCCRD